MDTKVKYFSIYEAPVPEMDEQTSEGEGMRPLDSQLSCSAVAETGFEVPQLHCWILLCIAHCTFVKENRGLFQ